LTTPGDGALASGRRLGGADRDGQAHGGEHGRVPGAEVLGGVVVSGDLAQVVVDVPGRDVMPVEFYVRRDATTFPARADELRNAVLAAAPEDPAAAPWGRWY
jgi:hypothetical protein